MLELFLFGRGGTVLLLLKECLIGIILFTNAAGQEAPTSISRGGMAD